MPHEHQRAGWRQPPGLGDTVAIIRGLTLTGSPVWSGLAALILCAALSGCDLARPNFQMNSNSPIPFFGIDLLPRRKTTSLVNPPAGEQWTSSAAVTGELQTVDDTPSKRRFWQRNAKSVDLRQSTLVLPLSTPHPDQPIDRGPVELLP